MWDIHIRQQYVEPLAVQKIHRLLCLLQLLFPPIGPKHPGHGFVLEVKEPCMERRTIFGSEKAVIGEKVRNSFAYLVSATIGIVAIVEHSQRIGTCAKVLNVDTSAPPFPFKIGTVPGLDPPVPTTLVPPCPIQFDS
jgi:hypothetical protein